MNIVLLDAVTFGDTDLRGFDDLGAVIVYQTTKPEELDERIANADVIVTNKVVITAEAMQKAKKLNLICIAATGMNNVDLEAAKKCGIEVRNVAGYSTNSVVQHTFSMLFYLVGHSRYYDEAVKSGSWSKSGVFTDVSHPFFEISGKKWGVIGLGTIGRKVAVLAKAFGADVSYFSTSGRNLDSEFNSVTLDELLEESDIITIHAPLNNATLNLLNHRTMSKCKDGVVILNLGRGGIINEADAAMLLDEKDIYFGLDVLHHEPIPQNHPLLQVENKDRLYITPHIAWTSKEARDTLIASVVENIRSL
ncbi:D-2-hydroxyacid dehydrogenase [Sulfurimonas sp. HSL3-2]|uniref:D-2-hydroxyacid dehydrogenase n=1 Tax=Hydrocurvibacter mobilis TaxID=3131936 RepID=UPI0031F85462